MTPELWAALTSQPSGVRGVGGRKGCSSGSVMNFVLLDGGVGLRPAFLLGDGLTCNGVVIPFISLIKAAFAFRGLLLRPGLARPPGLALGRRA